MNKQIIYISSKKYFNLEVLRFKFSLKNPTIILRFVWLHCSGGVPLVLLWYSFGILGCSAGVPGNVQLFRHFSGVFRSSAGVPCSGVPGFIVCLAYVTFKKNIYSNVQKMFKWFDFWNKKTPFIIHNERKSVALIITKTNTLI